MVEQAQHHIIVIGPSPVFDCICELVVLAVFENIRTDAHHYQSSKPRRFGGGKYQERPGPERKPNGVDLGSISKGARQSILKLFVGRRLTRLGRRTVPQQVRTDDLAPFVGQKIRPTVVCPTMPKRRTEAVDEHHRIGHARTLPGFAGTISP